jgi:probable phosphoglycerate mutase
MDAQARVVTAIDRLANRHRKGSIVIASHGDIVRIALAHYLATPLDDFQRIVVDTAAVSVVLLGGARPHVLLVNDTGGLERFRAEHTAPWEASKTPDRRRNAKVRG